MASVEQLTERILYRLSLDMQVRALAERLLHRFAETVGDLPASEKHHHSALLECFHPAGELTHASPAVRPIPATKRTEITKRTKLDVKDCSFCKYGDPVLPEPNFPVSPDEIIGWQAHLKSFREALRHSPTTDRIASFALHGDRRSARAAGCSSSQATCTEPSHQMLLVILSISKDISDHMKFDEAFGGTTLDPNKIAEWLFGKTLGHPYLLTFISPRTSESVPYMALCELLQFSPVVFGCLEQGKLNKDLAHLSEKEVGLLRAITQSCHDEGNPSSVRAEIPAHLFQVPGRTGKGSYKLYQPLVRKFLQRQE